MTQDQKNTRLAVAVGLVIGLMVGAAYAAVPLYRLVCQVTGFGGTPRQAVAAVGVEKVLDREMTVRFDANVGGGLPWRFKPVENSQTVRIGEQALAFFEVTNTSDKPVTGTATFNVAPLQAAYFFAKLECFCFTEQTLLPGQTVSMPVSYFIDPEIVNNRDAQNVTTVTLSYTFYPSTKEPQS